MIKPGSTIGILGGGQLGRMIALSAAAMGYKTAVYSPAAGECAKLVTNKSFDGEYHDFALLREFADSCDVITYEFENIPLACVQFIEGIKPLSPGSGIIKICQNRIAEKNFLTASGIPTNKFKEVKSLADLEMAVGELGFPAVMKTTELGYDGKGQVIIKSAADIKPAFDKLGKVTCILEEFIDFEREISVIVARTASGECKMYPPVHNIHKHHILDETSYPAGISEKLAQEALEIASAIAGAIGLVGILAVEMFVGKNGIIYVNELAPRPHNSGHWTMNACATSQFEQVVRAICGLPLGSTVPLCNARMKNLIGLEVNDWPKYYEMHGAVVHIYDKGEAKAGRKMGHVNFIEELL